MVDMPLTGRQPSLQSSKLQADDITRLRDQLWVGLMLVTIVVLVVTLAARYVMGDPTPVTSLLIQGTLHAVAFANLLLRNTRHASVAQGLYVICIHLAVPPVFILYGGTRGFGDVALLTAVIVAMLYGWRRWMLISFGIMALTLAWVLYRDSIGQPVAPLLDYSAQFTALKFVILVVIMAFILRYTHVFYNGLLERYRRFGEEQVRLNAELRANAGQLEQLTRSLKVSRQQIIAAREEERRRLRRDLHDGLGPTLASQIFRAGLARQTMHADLARSETLLADLESGLTRALTDLRELVYGLRPPTLDQLGLFGAVVNLVQQYDTRIAIDVQLPAQPPTLAAAVEVAAFRIMQTALDNVIKHARATACVVRIDAADDMLCIMVSDDGIGIASGTLEGVGLNSMRERAEEMGGTFDVVTGQPAGTRITVTIPLFPSDKS